MPGLTVWLILGLLLVVPKGNRHLQAWLILIPVALVVLLGPIPARLMSAPSSSEQMLGFLLGSLAKAWAVVWLLGPMLARMPSFLAFVATLTVMLATLAVCHVGEFGADDASQPLPMLMMFGLFSLAWLLAMTLSRFHCRKRYGPGRFMAWLLFWTWGSVALVLSIPVILTIAFGGPPPWGVLAAAVIMSLIGAAGLYLTNLPFMILAFKSPFYRDRLLNAFRLQSAGASTLEAISGRSGLTMQQVGEDVAGPWEFYIDELASTVVLDFEPDGTFRQAILENQGRIVHCPGGTWRREGAAIHLTGYVTAARGTAESRTWQIVDAPSGLALIGGDDSDSGSFVPLTRRPQLLAVGPEQSGG